MNMLTLIWTWIKICTYTKKAITHALNSVNKEDMLCSWRRSCFYYSPFSSTKRWCFCTKVYTLTGPLSCLTWLSLFCSFCLSKKFFWLKVFSLLSYLFSATLSTLHYHWTKRVQRREQEVKRSSPINIYHNTFTPLLPRRSLCVCSLDM